MICFAFVLGVLTDVAWTRWAIASAEHQAVTAANWSVITYLCAVASTWLVCQNKWNAIAAFAAGCWLGTYWGVG